MAGRTALAAISEPATSSFLARLTLDVDER